MGDPQTGQQACSGPSEGRGLDALLIGAGVAGLYQLYLLREQGFKVLACDTASGVGGTWYWNRYPGAKFDSESCIYRYLFSEELYKGWTWSQRFPGQAEIERWMNYVAERLDLRRDIRFNTRVTSARFDEEARRWIVISAEGAVFDTRFLVTCCGMLSAPLTSVFPGQDRFEGEVLHTARWPQDSIDLVDKRVGIGARRSSPRRTPSKTECYVGANGAGKPRRVLSYAGGVGAYRLKCDDLATSGYQGFAMR